MTSPKRLLWFAAIPALLFVLACGGGGGGTSPGTRNSTVTGQVLDQNDSPVRGATVKADGRTATTNMNGTFVLEQVRDGIVEVDASVRDAGVDYRGRTYAILTSGEQRSNANIVVSPTGSVGRISGRVFDRSGFLLQGVAVFAYSGAGSAARAYTDDDGRFLLSDLRAGVTYEVKAMGQGYRSDSDNILVRRNDTVSVDFTLGSPASPALTPPQNFSVTTWVAPEFTRSRGALAWAKADFHKGKGQPITVGSSQTRAGGPIVEATLLWDEQRFADHLGWGIYRGTGTSGALRELEFNADPLSGFFQDVVLNQNAVYRYAATTLSASYPDFPAQTESDFSTIQTARTLNVLTGLRVDAGNIARWSGTSGAEEYAVYVFASFPTIGVDPVAAPAIITATSYDLDAFPMVAGRTYYVMVLGLANGRSSRTITDAVSFTP